MLRWFRVRIRLFISLICLSSGAFAALTAPERAANLESFEVVWKTVRDRNPGGKLNVSDWQAVHDRTRPLIQRAESMEEVRTRLREMLARVGLSHYAIIPADRYSEPSDADAPAAASTPNAPMASSATAAPSETPAAPPTEPAAPDSKMVTFGNLPQMELTFETKRLASGVGYIRFNEFLDPVSVMPKFEKAVKEYAGAPGIILDLRGNRGGIGIMAMGIAGFFVSESGKQLGEMTMNEGSLKFVIFPRAETYKGKLAILVDSGSASTTEILAQGMQDLGRARIFGTLTAGAALPSDIVKLPNGDRFQFAEASYTSVKGKVLEGNGVTPDVEVHGGAAVIEAAEAWILSK
jgi:hypothetical protein